MEENNKYIRFDWAIKHMLRDKANFDVLEGLITVLIGERVKILKILESESNQESADDKFNRVDIKAENDKGHIIIVEVQLTRQLYYLQRILYGASKAVTEHINLGDKYDKIKKIYSISILYCDMGKGSDYVYHGRTEFKGLHTGDDLVVTTKERDTIVRVAPKDVFPEYYLIRVNEFDKIPENPLDEWLDYLKNGKIKDNTEVPGLQQAKRKLQYLRMSERERQEYDRHIDNIMIQNDVLDTAKTEGFTEGFTEGVVEGRKALAREMLRSGVDPETVARLSGFTPEELTD